MSFTFGRLAVNSAENFCRFSDLHSLHAMFSPRPRSWRVKGGFGNTLSHLPRPSAVSIYRSEHSPQPFDWARVAAGRVDSMQHSDVEDSLGYALGFALRRSIGATAREPSDVVFV